MRSPENAERICTLIAEGYTLRQIGRQIGCDASAIAHWAREDDGFAQQYAHAMDLRVERMADELIEISDDGTNDWVERERDDDGEPITVPDHEHIQRSRLRVDTRKWLMAKMMPKKYGDKLMHAGADGGPLQIVTVNYADQTKD